MRWVRSIFLVYVAFTALLAAALLAGVAFFPVPKPDPRTMYLPYIDDIKSFDPLEVSDTMSSSVAGNIFECLYNYDYEARPFKLFPQLAAEMPKISKDGLVYTIPLRRGIHFYDPDGAVFPGGKGPEVKAADFVYSWKRILDFNISSANANHLDYLKGADEWRTYTEEAGAKNIDWSRPFEGAVAQDDYTLRITLKQPFPQFIYILAHLPTAPVPRAAINHYGEHFRDHPIGTGAYALRAADYLRQQQLTFHANPFFRGRPDVDGLTPVPSNERMPFVQRIQLNYYDDSLPVWFLFRRGLLDTMEVIPKEKFSEAVRETGEVTKDMRDQGIDIIREVQPVTRFMTFNMADGLIGKNKPLRQAMSMAINREEYIKVYLRGRGLLARSIVPPGFDIYDENLENPYVRFDPEGAKAKLREAAKVHGGPLPPVKLLLPGTDTRFRQLADFLRTSMKRVGIELDVEYTNWARFLQIIEHEKTAPLFYQSWQADWPDEQNFFQLFWSKNISDGGLNAGSFHNAEFDRIYEEAVVMSSSPRRRELYQKMRDIINEEVACILVYHDVDMFPRHHWLTNHRINEYPHGRRMHVKIDFAERERWLARQR